MVEGRNGGRLVFGKGRVERRKREGWTCGMVEWRKGGGGRGCGWMGGSEMVEGWKNERVEGKKGGRVDFMPRYTPWVYTSFLNRDTLQKFQTLNY
jgi:hypothetical protein